MSDCTFCKIASGAIPSKKVHEDDHFIAFPDLHPQAKTHLLVIPKKHSADLTDADSATRAGLLNFVVATAEKAGLASGFRTVINTGKGGGQSVFHLHAHILGGSSLKPTFWMSSASSSL